MFLPTKQRACTNILLLVWFSTVCFAAAADDLEVGRALFSQHCVSCHGENGIGVSGVFERPLHGDRSVLDLADYIDRNMPEGQPELLDDQQSKLVAEFMHATFYTELARVRSQPPRPSLLRLTNRQLRESLADLVVRFRGRGQWSEQRGLTGAYRDGKWKGGFDRVDAEIDFHFGKEKPANIESEGEEYLVVWQGGVRSSNSGDYEFHIRSTNGFRLWVNDLTTPLIDAAVQSGDNTEFSANIKLLGGRVYPIKLEWKRAKGEDGSIQLLWKPPHYKKQLIAAEHLSPGWFPQVLVVTTPLPPDDSSFGYERGVGVSKEWKEAVTQVAVEAADFVVANLRELAGLNDRRQDDNRSEKIANFCYRWAMYALRRPLSDEEKRDWVDQYLNEEVPEPIKIKKVIFRSILSTDFLYVPIASESSARAKANRLALSLWDSIPDEELWQSAEEGWIDSQENLLRQASRLARDDRGQAKLRYFLQRWMQLDRAEGLSKDRQVYPDFDIDLAEELRESLDRFIGELLTSEQADYRELLQADYLPSSERMAQFYGWEWNSNGPKWQRISLEPTERAGILTHPFLMAGFAYQKSSSPIHRGVFLARKVLGRHLPNPPVAVAALDESIDPNLTTRERTMLQTRPESCQSCHTLINSLGFSLENYDAVGRFRLLERDRPVDASGDYRALSGDHFRFEGPRELARFIAVHPDAHEAFIEHLFHNVNQQPIFAFGERRLQDLVEVFQTRDFNIRDAFAQVGIVAANGIQLSH